MINLWVDVWDRKEHPRTLSILRITVALVLLMDLLDIGRNGLVEPLMAAASAGGWGGRDPGSAALLLHSNKNYSSYLWLRFDEDCSSTGSFFFKRALCTAQTAEPAPGRCRHQPRSSSATSRPCAGPSMSPNSNNN